VGFGLQTRASILLLFFLNLPMDTRLTSVLVLGWNPAYQRILQLSHFQPGGVNRASSLHKDVGGKGQQVAKALKFYSKYCRGLLLNLSQELTSM
jgi:hypothetical protein